jgi:uncharacterized protein YprB with RNaseH-like and TPR domain
MALVFMDTETTGLSVDVLWIKEMYDIVIGNKLS